MRIKKLWISNYKNIKNINLDFTETAVTLLVGKNGLGKSNLIEVLAIIFRDLDLLKARDDFDNWAYDPSNFEYIIHYESHQDELIISMREGGFTIQIRPIDSVEPFSTLELSDFLKSRSSRYLPKYILGYYSGENKRIRDIIQTHTDLQLTELKRWHLKASKSAELGFRRLFFTENYHSQLLLLTLILYRNHNRLGQKISKLFDEYLHIEEIVDFSITFNNPNWAYHKIDGTNKGLEYLYANISNQNPVEFPFWNVKGKVDQLLTRFYNHQIDAGREPIIYQNEGEDSRKFIKEFIFFKDISIPDFSAEVILQFEHPLDFFDALEASTTIEILTSIELKIKKKGITEPIGFTQLSEGEQQLLTVLGLLLTTAKDDCLFLLDEPDTHLNPNWQRKYANLLTDFDMSEGKSHIIVSTHSPLIVQSSEHTDVFLFKEINDQVIIDSKDHQLHNWRIDQVLASEYFEFDNTRPLHLDEFMRKRQELLSKKILSEEEKQQLIKWEENFSVLPTGETAQDIKALRLAYKFLFPDQIETSK